MVGSKKMRRCLKCRLMFASEGSGNRFCDKCANRNSKVYMPGLKTSKVLRSPRAFAREE